MPSDDFLTPALDAAAQRLARSLAALERKVESLAASAAPADMFADDRNRLAAALDRERARSRELEAAAEAASAALGRATAELRALMAEREEA